MADSFTPYTTAAPYFGVKPSWIPDPLDQARIQAYDAYERMYWNAPNTFKISLRGTNNQPIYVPSARTIVDTTARYVGAGFSVVVTGGNADAVAAAQLALADLIKRERFRSKFIGAKKYGLIQGDWLWHITADPVATLGKRITMTVIDPSLYFPLYDPDNVDQVIGCHLAELITTAEGERVRRVTYLITEKGTVSVQEALYKTDDWYRVEAAIVTVIRPVQELPPDITTLPVYHTKNTEEPGNPFGSSELRGLEPIMGALNQTMSDEDLALALMGIGMWATDASRPIDPDTRKPVNWQMGPGRVIHHDGQNFSKVAGVGDLAESYGEHYNRLFESVFQASSTPEIAVGSADVTVASGVALQLQLGPMVSKAEEKNGLVLDSHDQMFYDILTQWMPAYEETQFPEIAVNCVVGDAIPVDREGRFAELNDMLDRGVIDTAYYRLEAAKLGYTFPTTLAATAKAEFDERQQDQFGARLDSETE
jgi:hypothetical protein